MPISIESFQTQSTWKTPSTAPFQQPVAAAQSNYFNFFIGGILTVVFLFAIWIIFAVTMHQFVMPHTN